MPIFDWKCECGYKGEHIAKVEEELKCPNCLKVMKRQMPGTHGINMGVGAYGYYDDNLEAYVHTNRQRRELMRQRGVQEKFGKGWY